VLVNLLAVIGQVFIAVTLGALFAGVFSAALTALIERLDFLRTVIASFF
jgi:energy-converting hydrogenase Eha subunit A